jgi:hypothetical protein
MFVEKTHIYSISKSQAPRYSVPYINVERISLFPVRIRSDRDDAHEAVLDRGYATETFIADKLSKAGWS